MDKDSGQCRIHRFSGCDISGHVSIPVDSEKCSDLPLIQGKGCSPCQAHRDSENARLDELPFPMLGYFVPECDEDGNFKSKQSSGSSGYKFCLDIDGNKIDGSDTPPGQELDCMQYLLNRWTNVNGKKTLFIT